MEDILFAPANGFWITNYNANELCSMLNNFK